MNPNLMKRFSVIILLLSFSFSMFSQEENVKTGWIPGPLPSVSFNTDLGFQYGVLLQLNDYGDGSNYPGYNHFFYGEISRYTKGSGTNRFSYDSDQLIPGVKFTTDIAYLTAEAFDFTGFNGYEAVYNAGWEDDEQGDYKSRMFYKHQRKLFRFKNDFRGKLYGDNLYWSAGFAVKSFKIESVNIEKLNDGKDDNLLPAVEDVPGIYEQYRDWGIINAEEADGGLITTLKAGVTWDSRDFKANAMKGVWFETGLEISPGFLSEDSFTRFYAIYRQYLTLIPEDLSFAYRIGYQTKIGDGHVPFYYQNQLITSTLTGTSNEGLGGDKSIRGLIQNRIMGDGVVYGNFELRWKALYFNFINQNWYLGFIGFFDAGLATKNIDFDLPAAFLSGETVSDYFIPESEKLHMGTGAGLRMVMNQNFIIKLDYGFALDEQDGSKGMYIGLNYLF